MKKKENIKYLGAPEVPTRIAYQAIGTRDKLPKAPSQRQWLEDEEESSEEEAPPQRRVPPISTSMRRRLATVTQEEEAPPSPPPTTTAAREQTRSEVPSANEEEIPEPSTLY